jgi:hypothetical protein
MLGRASMRVSHPLYLRTLWRLREHREVRREQQIGEADLITRYPGVATQ